jgi:hypothetical protein
MKAIAYTLTIAVALAVMSFALPAAAADQVLQAPVQSVKNAIGKDGSPYTRVIIEQTFETGGINYKKGIPVMFFDDAMAEQTASLKPGDTLKAVVSPREYQGRISYTGMALIK